MNKIPNYTRYFERAGQLGLLILFRYILITRSYKRGADFCTLSPTLYYTQFFVNVNYSFVVFKQQLKRALRQC